MNTHGANQSGSDHSLSSNEQSVKESLDQYMNSEVNNLDFNVSSKLAAARHRALDQSPANPHRGTWQIATGGGVALAAALVVGSQFYQPATDVTAIDVPAVAQNELMEDLPLLASSDDIEFYQSIEFLEWLENNS